MRIASLILLISLAFILPSKAQVKKCPSHDILHKAMDDKEISEKRRILEGHTNEWDHSTRVKSNDKMTIPVVFHIIQDGSVADDFITDVLIAAQMKQLNDDFGRTNSDKGNTPVAFKNFAADTEINFRLADFEPDGSPSSAILRYQASALGVSENQCMSPFFIDQKIKTKTIWDAKKYLNIYIVNKIDDEDDEGECDKEAGIIGYAQFPDGGPTNTDAVVLLSYSVGSIDMPNPLIKDFLGRTLTHEVGHWLNLYHIWGDDSDDPQNACRGSDKVEDTPNQETFTSGCPRGKLIDHCTPNEGGVMYQNYMDYSDDECMNIITKGQKNRMLSALMAARPELLLDQPFKTDDMEEETDDDMEEDDDKGEIGDMAENCDNILPLSDENVFINGSIYTVNEAQPWAEAMIVKGDTITFLGSTIDALDMASEKANIINLKKKMIMPGIHDVHMHPLEAGSSNFDFLLETDNTDLGYYKTKIDKAQKSKPDSTWLLGWGHDIFVLLDSDERPIDILDAINAERPIAIMEQTSHSIWCNSAALVAADINEDSENPIGGVIMRDEEGLPNGILVDNAGNIMIDLAVSIISSSEENDYDGLVNFSLPELARHGITSICDARTYWKRNHHLTWQRLAAENQLTVRVNLGLWTYPSENDSTQIAILKSLYQKSNNGLLNINQIKVYSDGIIPNTTAAIHDDYLIDLFGESSNNGVNYFTERRLGKYIKELEPFGFDFHIHAIGNRAINESINAIEKNGSGSGRHRITHLEVIDTSDYVRFRALDITADCQVAGDFTHPDAWHDNDDFIDSSLSDNIIPLKSLSSKGARITLSSDWDVSTLNPFVGIQNAVTRSPQELTLKEAIEAYTINASYVMRQEDKVGTLEVGKEADFIVLDQNIFEINTDQIAETAVLMTFLQGEQIYPIMAGNMGETTDTTDTTDQGGIVVEYDSLGCLQIKFPIYAVLSGDSLEINSASELQGLLALCSVDEMEEPGDTTNVPEICFVFVYPLQLALNNDTIPIADPDQFISFLNHVDSTGDFFDFVYPMLVISNDKQIEVFTFEEVIELINICNENDRSILGSHIIKSFGNHHSLYGNTQSKNGKSVYFKDALKIFPNPTSDKLYVQWPQKKSRDNVDFSIIDAQGKIFYQETQTPMPKSINTEMLSTGVYIFQVKTDEGIYQSVFVVNK
ncbi:MAG: amidohydrolase family protein [Saprospiraceae bacterium]